MEQNTIQWLGAPCCMRGSFAFYKAVSCCVEPGGPSRVWRLGEFYYVRCGPQEPVCIAEVTLLWEDQRQRHLLASARLYFWPEDTPKGRMADHGEDEVLGVSKKTVIRVEDLVNWTCSEPPQWSRSSPKSNGLKTSERSSDGQEVKTEENDGSPVQQRVKVLSYPQYCRFRSLQKRIQHKAASHDLQDPHLLALGGIQLALHNTRVLYCRDTFNHPTLSNNPSLMSQFGCASLSLKGRPRKRRRRESSGTDQQTQSQSDSWGERMKENLKGEMEMRWEGNWLPHPEEQLFLDKLYLFMERRGSPISKVPNLGFKKIDLFLMYSVVKKLGGYETVTSQRLWKTVYNELGGSPGSTSAATCTRRHYEKLMLPYEQHVKGGNQEQSKPRAPAGLATNVKKLARGRGAPTAAKKNEPPSPGTPPDGAVVRKRGRPPGRRNAKAMPRGKVGRPPLHVKIGSDPGGCKEAQTLPVFQELRLSQTQASAVPHHNHNHHTHHNHHHHHHHHHHQLKVDEEPSAPSSLPGQCKLQIGGSVEGFSPTKGMCPLDLFRARLGLNGVGSPETSPQDPSVPQQTAVLVQTKAGSPEMPQNLQHQCSGCGIDNLSWSGGPKEGRTTKPPLPPLKILPLDIDCSLQLRQLMRTRLGSAHMNSFTKRLSEALAQDLSKTYPPANGHAVPAVEEQAVPLNLSKKATFKRSSDDMELRDSQCSDYGDYCQAKNLKMEPEDLSLTPKQNGSSSGVPFVQDEPADLSSPHRARALSQDRTISTLTGSGSTHASPKPNPDVSGLDGVASSPVGALKQEESDSLPVDLDLKKTENPGWKKEPERTLARDPQGDLTQFQDSKTQYYNVPSLKELSSSHLSKPSQSG